jgi:hypothetical protein
LAADLVDRKVDVIVTNGPSGALVAKGATSTIPIVFNDLGDPVGVGLVASLARPEGNLTGFSILTVELMPKRSADQGDGLAGEPEQSEYAAQHSRRRGGGACEGSAAPDRESRH